MPPGKFCKITPKNTHFCAFWKQVLDNTVLQFFISKVWGGGHGTVASPLRTLVVVSDSGHTYGNCRSYSAVTTSSHLSCNANHTRNAPFLVQQKSFKSPCATSSGVDAKEDSRAGQAWTNHSPLDSSFRPNELVQIILIKPICTSRLFKAYTNTRV